MRWTQDEDARLREAVAELGKGKWGLVADRLGTGRTPSAVEQHWQVMTGQRKSPEYYAARRPAAKCKGPKAEGSLAQPQPDEWRKEGHPLIGRSIIRLGPSRRRGNCSSLFRTGGSLVRRENRGRARADLKKDDEALKRLRSAV